MGSLSGRHLFPMISGSEAGGARAAHSCMRWARKAQSNPPEKSTASLASLWDIRKISFGC